MDDGIKSRYIPDSQDRNGVATVEESTVIIEGKGFAGTELVAEDRKRKREISTATDAFAPIALLFKIRAAFSLSTQSKMAYFLKVWVFLRCAASIDINVFSLSQKSF